MRKIVTIVVIGLMLGVASCTEDPITKPDYTYPEIEDILVPSSIFLDGETQLIQAVINDPQGPANIQSATLILINPAGNTKSIAMRDDGQQGDILASDGQFVVSLGTNDWENAGDAELSVEASDKDGNTSTSETVAVTIRPGSRGTMPVINSIEFADSIRIDSTYNVQLLANVEDAQGLGTIDSVIASVYQINSATPLEKIQMLDDGTHDDGVAGNGIYGAQIVPTEIGLQHDFYILRINAFDAQGNISEVATYSFRGYKFPDVAPVIVSISADSVISRSDAEYMYIKVTVSDRNGLENIRRVYFNSFLPDGTASSNNPFLLSDNGLNTEPFFDEAAGDGIYSRVVEVPTDASLGEYRFEFQAEDWTFLKSQKVTHILTVVE